ncbi:MAG: efflux RND transporter periplasmic adaptor subunit [Planctomycetota bacterium]
MRTLLFLGSLLALSWAPTLWAQTPVLVEPLASSPTQQFERVTGSLRARSTSVMAALEEGVLLEVAVREGDAVEAGATLARVDTRRLEASRVQLQAQLALGEAQRQEKQIQVDDLRADLAALESAGNSGAVSSRDLRRARTALLGAQASLQAAEQSIAALEASRDLLDIRIHDAVLRAPFAGRVVARHAEIGQWIRPGEPVVTLVSSGTLEAWLTLPERFATGVDLGSETMPITLEALGIDVPARRPRLVPEVDLTARTLPLILDLDSPQGMTLQPGMSIAAMVPVGKREARLVVHPNALIQRGPQTMLVKVGEGNRAEWVPVTLLFRGAQGVSIAPLDPTSLKPGDQIVVEGNERAYPGTELVPQIRGAQGGAPEGQGKSEAQASSNG